MNNQKKDVLGHYTLQESLGTGGMAEVFRAIDTRNNKTVALKILFDQLIVKQGMVKRFENEARIMASLHHPNIIQVYEHGISENRSFIAMAYHTKGSLDKLFKHRTKMKLNSATQFLAQIANALDFAHEQGVIHRDLKLENILLSDTNQAILTDFGIAKLLDSSLQLTHTNSTMGTPLYISPEQALNSKDIDYRTDLYSFAVIAYFIATGEFPFVGDSPFSVLRQHIEVSPPKPSQINPDLTPSVDRVLLRGMAKDPDKRYQRAQDFIQDFNKAIQNDQIGLTYTYLALDDQESMVAKVAQRSTIGKTNAPNTAHWSFFLLPLLLLLIAGGILVALFLMNNPENDDTTSSSIPMPLTDTETTIQLTHTDERIVTNTLSPTWTSLPTVTITSSQTSTPSLTSTPSATYTTTTTNTATATLEPTASGRLADGIEGANLRTGPGVNYEVQQVIDATTRFSVIAVTQDESPWYLVELSNGITGWLSGGIIFLSDNSMEIAFAETIPPLPTETLTPTITSTPAPICGDLVCDENERDETCPQDCALIRKAPEDFCTRQLKWAWFYEPGETIVPPGCLDRGVMAMQSGTYMLNGGPGHLAWVSVVAAIENGIRDGQLRAGDYIEIFFVISGCGDGSCTTDEQNSCPNDCDGINSTFFCIECTSLTALYIRCQDTEQWSACRRTAPD